MVHALHEARRVLRPDGLLIDLRPAPVHRQVGVMLGGRFQRLGIMRERFDDDHAASRAVAAVVAAGLLVRVRSQRFVCHRTMDRLDEFNAWLDEFVCMGKLPVHARLARRVAQVLRDSPARTKIVVSGPLDLRVLRKA